jgi:hypothetical protein
MTIKSNHIFKNSENTINILKKKIFKKKLYLRNKKTSIPGSDYKLSHKIIMKIFSGSELGR